MLLGQGASLPQGLNVVSQDVVYIRLMRSNEEGYGKDGKLKNAFHFPTTSAAATGMNLLTLHMPGG
jgi:hypothetical protein